MAKVIRLSDEAYTRLLNASRVYGLSMAQIANVFILGSAQPRHNGKGDVKGLTSRGRVSLGKETLKCPKCRGDLGLVESEAGLYMLKCRSCFGGLTP